MYLEFKSIRIRKKIKQKDFAESLGITQQYLSRIENGKVDIKTSMLFKISKLLNVSIEELIDMEE